MVLVKRWMFSLNIQNSKSDVGDGSLFFLRNIKIITKMQNFVFGILVKIALTVGQFWKIEKITPKYALLSLSILYSGVIQDSSKQLHST